MSTQARIAILFIRLLDKLESQVSVAKYRAKRRNLNVSRLIKWARKRLYAKLLDEPLPWDTSGPSYPRGLSDEEIDAILEEEGYIPRSKTRPELSW